MDIILTGPQPCRPVDPRERRATHILVDAGRGVVGDDLTSTTI